MSVTFIGASTADQDDDFTFSFDVPAGTRAGDVLVLIAGLTVTATDADVHFASSVTGWTEAIFWRGTSDPTNGDALFVVSYEATGSEGARLTVRFDTALTASPLVEVLAYRGILPPGSGHPFATTAVLVTGTTTWHVPGQTPRSSGDVYLGIVHDPGLGQAFTLPGTTRYLDNPADSTLGIFEIATGGAAVATQNATATTLVDGTALSLLLFEADPRPYKRMLMDLLPPGRLWRLLPGVVGGLGALLEGCAMGLLRVHGRADRLLEESDPRTAVELLSEYERELALDRAPTNLERRARIVSRLISRTGYRPVDFQTVLAPLLGTVTVIERTHAFAVALEDDREIFRFFIYRDPTDPGTYYVQSAQEQLDLMKPSHTAGLVIESVSFLYDDEFSLYDRDLMGA